jgi:hypothetical protein
MLIDTPVKLGFLDSSAIKCKGMAFHSIKAFLRAFSDTFLDSMDARAVPS